MRNLLKETINDINKSGHKIEDIVFVGSKESEYSCRWEEFSALSSKEYDDYAVTAEDLIIVFNDGQTMWRETRNGFEGWIYSKPFTIPDGKKKIKSLFANEWRYSLKEINEV